jgi:hypothetical protein
LWGSRPLSDDAGVRLRARRDRQLGKEISVEDYCSLALAVVWREQAFHHKSYYLDLATCDPVSSYGIWRGEGRSLRQRDGDRVRFRSIRGSDGELYRGSVKIAGCQGLDFLGPGVVDCQLTRDRPLVEAHRHAPS